MNIICLYIIPLKPNIKEFDIIINNKNDQLAHIPDINWYNIVD